MLNAKEKIAESRCDFVLQDVGEERLMPRVCPEKEERLKAKC
jgi:hypothetical protein